MALGAAAILADPMCPGCAVNPARTSASRRVTVVAGVIGWGGFNWALEITNTETFCISCHEMERNVYNEYQGSIHDENATGVRATCPDCHVPKDWIHKVQRKIAATNELYHHFLGTVETPKKFEERRGYLALRVWKVMVKTDSRECRNYHSFTAMDVAEQEDRARDKHLEAMDEGGTCIDCHKGIAHELLANARELEQQLGASIETLKRYASGKTGG
jgi:cytochrome c-type protein NapC